ncbi:MAG: hypothetical protein UW42_C0043G0001, partial [Candidatus Collierbacteria bacterium GW2011_GWB1_44_197]
TLPFIGEFFVVAPIVYVYYLSYEHNFVASILVF